MAEPDMLTDVEAVALAIVRRGEPCTSYAVRKSFEVSPVSRFSSSAGSIYPLMKRLEKRGLIVGEPDATGDRPRTLWRCAKDGEAALRAWITRPIEPGECLPFDPLRTRMLFLKVLTPKQRLDWIETARAHVEAAIESIKAYEDDTPIEQDVFFQLAQDSCNSMLRMQQRWLNKAYDTLTSE